MKSTKAERKFTQERKVGHRGCVGRGNVVALRRKWQEALQTIQPSEGTCPGVRGRQRCVVRWIPHQAKTSVDEPLGGSAMSCGVRLGRDRGRVRPGATGGGTAECCSAGSVVCLHEFVVVCVLAAAGHFVETGASGDENSSGAVAMSFRAGARAGSAEQDPTIRGARTWQVGIRCLARVKGQGRIGLENLEIASLDSGSKSKGGRRSIL